MKILNLLSVLVVTVCLTSCEKSELVTCQQDIETLQTKVDALQQQLKQANTTITDKDHQNELCLSDAAALQAKLVEKTIELVNKDKQLNDLKAQNRIQQNRIGELEQNLASLAPDK